MESVRGQRRLAAVCPVADAEGLRSGMPLTQARAMCPALSVTDADPAGDRAGLAALAAWAERYTPLAAAAPPEGLLLDIAGCAHLFSAQDDDGEYALASDLLARLTRRGLPARAAIAGTAAAAWALARWHPALTVLPPGGEAAALATLPLGLLQIEARAAAGLLRLGIRTVGDLARLPRGEITARFGTEPLRRLDEAFGRVAEQLVWPHPPAPWRAQRAFAEPIGTAGDLARAIALLAAQLCQRLADAAQGAQRFTVTFLRVDGARPAIGIATAQPVRNAAYVAKLLTAKLETLDPGHGIDAVVLEADAAAPLAPPQAGFAALDAASGSADLAATVDELVNRLGEHRLWRPLPGPSHVPERSVRRAAPLASPLGWTGSTAPARPLRLLRRPEPIEASALVPDDPPFLFRWRGCLHRVRAASGPERLAAEWWRGARPAPEREAADLVRDYYRVEDQGGARFWLFRTGRNAGAPGTRWFLHGVFG